MLGAHRPLKPAVKAGKLGEMDDQGVGGEGIGTPLALEQGDSRKADGSRGVSAI